MNPTPISFWIGFNVFVVIMLTIDLGVLNRRPHEISIKESLIWTGVCVAAALTFNVIIYFWRGSSSALEFLTGYLIEYSLSMDNIFVFIMIFSYFHVPRRYQHRVLFFGSLGALIMRGIFIAAGVTLIKNLHWVIYVLGAFLVVTGIRMAIRAEAEIHPSRNPVLRLFRRFVPITHDYVKGKFFVRDAGSLLATPLFVVLLVVETTDVMFAVDSIPAILAITLDPFIVYTSNVFAIIGLRALFFALSGIMGMFHFLHYGLSAILVFVGIKMLVADLYEIPIVAALGVVAAFVIYQEGGKLVRTTAALLITAGLVVIALWGG